MKGAIFKLFEDFVDSTYGPDAFDELVDTTELATTEPFVGPGNYPPSDLVALVATAAAVNDTTVACLLHAFGRHAFPSLAASVPSLLDGLDTPRDFLCGLESVIHTEVRKLDPDADPARFSVTDLGPDEILLRYQSPLALFPLVEGFLAGIGDWFGVPIASELIGTGDDHGTFRVHFQPSTSGATAAAATNP